MLFKANVWVYWDGILRRPGDPFSAPAKMSEAWIPLDPVESAAPAIEDAPVDSVKVETTATDAIDMALASPEPEKPRRGRPPKDR